MENDDSVEYWLSILGDAQPTFATMPTPGAPNELAAVEKVAKVMGTPLIPVQRFIVRVVTEKLPNGHYRYPIALITLPRQCGKSALLQAIGVMRNLTTKSTDLFYMAQKGKDGREQVEKTYKAIEGTFLADLAHHRKSNDNAQIEWTNGSRFRFAVPTEESLHGKTFPWFFWDELFAVEEQRGNEVYGAAGPAQQTRKDRQTIMVSTKGTKKSTYLNKWLKKGQLAVKKPGSRMAYFEWALADGLDAGDPANWKFHPGLGHLITEEEIAEFMDNMDRFEFERAFMNRMTNAVTSALDSKKWAGLVGTPVTVPGRSAMSVGWELSDDESSAAVVGAWREADGKIGLKIIRAGGGSKWLPDVLRSLTLANVPDILADKYPQNQMVADQFAVDNYGIALRLMRTDEAKTAAVAFKSLLNGGMFRHDGHPMFRDAVSTAQTRRVGEGYVFSHEHNDPVLLAAIAAVRGITEQKVHHAPEIEFAD